MDYNSDLINGCMDQIYNRKENINRYWHIICQFYKTGQINLQGVDENNSFGNLALQNAKPHPMN